ncbi:hypothetical protein DYD83_11720 [Dickeya fangzhongdai]|uniref:Uncharacterized protein n=1 Tax=Dickeya fangzhongdai TaxID=1778540 RepID=A0A2K8QM32_9GAMM|nr:hypothetical protein CVE23_11670 [Dickeya fangzhongdai]QOH48015.1 hypothetical protein DYD82_11720 [Dickeya fangzhongdai]QOH52320.1 hypothetical protein DYD83_11720 [Dickeya fangzhongdai]
MDITMVFLLVIFARKLTAVLRVNVEDIKNTTLHRYIYPSYFKLQMRWLPSLTPVTYLCKLLGIHSVAAFLQLELSVYRIIEIVFLSGVILRWS